MLAELPRTELAQASSGIVIEEWTPVLKGPLRGVARIRLGSGMIIHGVMVFRNDDSTWAMPPGKPQLDRNGTHFRGADGKLRYSDVISFANKHLRQKFSDKVVDAVQRYDASALS